MTKEDRDICFIKANMQTRALFIKFWVAWPNLPPPPPQIILGLKCQQKPSGENCVFPFKWASQEYSKCTFAGANEKVRKTISNTLFAVFQKIMELGL